MRGGNECPFPHSTCVLISKLQSKRLPVVIIKHRAVQGEGTRSVLNSTLYSEDWISLCVYSSYQSTVIQCLMSSLCVVNSPISHSVETRQHLSSNKTFFFHGPCSPVQNVSRTFRFKPKWILLIPVPQFIFNSRYWKENKNHFKL